MIQAIKYNLASVTKFQGRDSRSTFWFYVLFLFILQFILGLLIAVPSMGAALGGAFNAVSEGVSEAEMQQRMFASMASTMRTQMTLSFVVSLLCALLLVASFVRRLHDSNKPGWIAAIPFVMVLAGQAVSWANIGTMIDLMTAVDPTDPEAMMAMQKPMYMASGLTYLGYIIVIIFGVWPSSDGDNRYGPEPDHI